MPGTRNESCFSGVDEPLALLTVAAIWIRPINDVDI